MSVAGDGDDAELVGESRGLPPAAGPQPRHRVPPTASAAARVLPEPFTPPKPTIPHIPHQRRPDGPTAVASVSVPPAGSVDDEPDPSPVATLAGQARADAAAMDQTQNLEFIVSLPGITNDPDAVSPPPADEPEEPVEPVETVEGELLPVGPTMAADDSPTVADYRAPALTIVTDYAHEDAEDYRGSRRRLIPWRRYPVGALAVAVLLLLILGAVVFQAVDRDDPGGPRNSSLPGQVPGVDTGGNNQAPAGASPTADDQQTDPETQPATAVDATTTRPQTATTVPAPPSTSAQPPSTAATTTSAAPPPPVAQPPQGRLTGAQSHKCLEYRTGSSNRVVLDNCSSDGNQQWKVVGNAATGATVVADNGKCLDVANAATANGTAVQVYTCNNTAAQKWIRRADNSWQNPNSKRCLWPTNNGTGAGTALVIWDCVPGAQSQIFTLQ
ncbi:RICIN domain-containing protein [Dactylosporangium sp. NPDC051541]|uniref:RICIN domain-containing protein n=1 Tax=Dactylosporangium sp. NPDC051541 TaxID=3363977 RepID=UPI00378E1E0D